MGSGLIFDCSGGTLVLEAVSGEAVPRFRCAPPGATFFRALRALKLAARRAKRRDSGFYLYGSNGQDLIHTRKGEPDRIFWSRIVMQK